MKLACIGTGNMGKALVSGFISGGVLKNTDINCFDVSPAALKSVADSLGVNVFDSAAECVKGCDYVVNDGKAYAIMKTYTDLQDKSTLFICVESIAGFDNKKVFNNLDRSSIIIKPSKKEEQEDANNSGE